MSFVAEMIIAHFKPETVILIEAVHSSHLLKSKLSRKIIGKKTEILMRFEDTNQWKHHIILFLKTT